MAHVYGGSATLQTSSPLRMVDVTTPDSLSWALDLQISGGPVAMVRVTTGAGQTAIAREYRCDAGRLVLPLSGNSVAVDAYPEAVPAGGAAVARVLAILSPNTASNAPLAPSTATAAALTVAAATPLTVGQSAGAGRILRNVSCATLVVRIGGLDCYSIALGATLELGYAGAFILFSPLGGTVNVVALHP